MASRMPVVTLPLIQHLQSVLSDTHVAPNLNGYTQDQKWVEVTQAPGARVTNRRLDLRAFSLNCYAPTFAETEELAEEALAECLSMSGVYGEIVITAVTVGVTPFSLSDQIDNQYRFVFDINVYVRRY